MTVCESVTDSAEGCPEVVMRAAEQVGMLTGKMEKLYTVSKNKTGS